MGIRLSWTLAVLVAMTIAPIAGVGALAPALATAQGTASGVDIESMFTPSGYMGDGEYGRKHIVFDGSNSESPHTPPSAMKITYTFGPQRWGGMYWQNVPDNWGDKPGTNYASKKFLAVTFWARGVTGTEVVEFKAGGINAASRKYRDSFQVTTGRVRLTKDWKEYRLDVSGADLRSVIGGFCWVASADHNNPKTLLTFYLDDILLR
jgi:hypothetical protein